MDWFHKREYSPYILYAPVPPNRWNVPIPPANRTVDLHAKWIKPHPTPNPIFNPSSLPSLGGAATEVAARPEEKIRRRRPTG
jgi:hypothetical protein